ncbi:hypothetical protein [Nocardioides alcanivorans]|uniref:hypothetical protein n=1 Tax=Nocardioides alcanivorans TaxID=2897352 RepID=UPI001F32B998|nr:hypothetical protein [Nocardioides alcanivorans]
MPWNLPPPRLPAPQFVTPVRADLRGIAGPKPSTARGSKWRRVAPHLFVPTDASLQQPAQRILEASLRIGDGRGAVSGWASLHLAGAPWFEGRDSWGRDLPVLLVSRSQITVPIGVRLLRAGVDQAELVLRHGVPCTGVHRALFDEIRSRGHLRPAVAAIDMALHAGLTTLDEFGAWLAPLRCVPGLVLAREALALAMPGAESPPESGLRLLWQLDARLGPPLPNVNLHSTSGRFLGRPDLFDPVAGVIGDYDGAHHRETRARAKDVAREELFRNHGLEYFSVVGGEMHRRQMIVERIHATYARAGASTVLPRWRVS